MTRQKLNFLLFAYIYICFSPSLSLFLSHPIYLSIYIPSYLECLEVLVAIVYDGQEHVDEDEVDKEDEHQEEQGAKHLGLKIGP